MLAAKVKIQPGVGVHPDDLAKAMNEVAAELGITRADGRVWASQRIFRKKLSAEKLAERLNALTKGGREPIIVGLQWGEIDGIEVGPKLSKSFDFGVDFPKWKVTPWWSMVLTSSRGSL